MVVVTPGGKPIMFFVILALVDPGDEVLYPNPGFPIYESMIRFIGGVPVPVRLLEEKAFALDVDQLVLEDQPRRRSSSSSTTRTTRRAASSRERACGRSRTRRPSTASRSSPTRSTARILYEGEHVSIAAMPGMEPHAIVLDGFSKTYAMTGWRLGYGIMPAPLAQVVAKLQTNAISCTATFTQLAGVEALRGDQSLRRARWSRSSAGAATRSSTACARSPASSARGRRAPSTCSRTSAGTGFSAKALADRLLDEAGVACLSGTAFGEFGEGHLRFCYANSLENIQEALRRVKACIGR